MCRVYTIKAFDLIVGKSKKFLFKRDPLGWSLQVGPVCILYWNKDYRM